MRLIMFVGGWPLERFPNGVIAAARALAPALRAVGCNVTILAATGDQSNERDHVTFLADGAIRKEPSLLRKGRSLLFPHHHVFHSMPARIAQAMHENPLCAGADFLEMEESFGWGETLNKKTMAGVVTRLHGPWFLVGAWTRGARALSKFDRERIRREGRAIAASFGVTAPSRFVLDRTRAKYELPLRDAHVIPNAAEPPDDSNVWSPERADKDELLFVGRFDSVKGADTVLHAFASLARTRPSLTLTFVGPLHGQVEHQKRFVSHSEFMSLALDSEIRSRIRFVGIESSANIQKRRARAAVTIIGSRIEMLPMTLLEAMAAGSPVVTTDVGGIPEIAADGIDALLTSPSNAPAMARRIEEILDSPRLAETLSKNARTKALSEYSPRSVAKKTFDYYQELAARRRSA